jgi:glucokinase
LHAIGIDIGGTKILGALVDAQGEIAHEIRVPSPAGDADRIVAATVELVRELLAVSKHPVLGAGIATAGFIDAEQSTVLYAPNLNFRNEPFRDKIAAQLELPIIIENDANAAGWAEFKFGAGRGVKDMIMLTLGTGVGGAVISDRELRRGGFGIAGELGHVRVVPEGRLCGCGLRGCLEQYASGTAVLKGARKLAGSGGPAGARLAELALERGELDGQAVHQALIEGDAGAMGLAREAGEHLGAALSSIIAVLDPEAIVIGGGLSEAGDLILDPIRDAFSRNFPARGYRPEAQIVAAQFSNQAGVLGAADLARQTLAKL